MLMKRVLQRATCAGLLLFATAGVASAQNALTNPGFENGPTGGGALGWTTFGNVYTEATSPFGNQFVPYAGNQLVSTFGNWWGVFNVSGLFQEFPTSEGAHWQLSSKSRHWSGDPMVGSQANGGNWVVQKIAWFNAGGTEIGGVESMILDGTFATDVWHDNAPIVGVAPPGTVKLQALILYLQPAFDGGAAHIDNVELLNLDTVGVKSSTWGKIKSLYGE